MYVISSQLSLAMDFHINSEVTEVILGKLIFLMEDMLLPLQEDMEVTSTT